MHILSLNKAAITKLFNKFIILFFLLLSVSAKAEISKHDQIIAGLLLHLTSFTHWEELESDSIELCLLGDDPFKTYIDKMIQRRPSNNEGKKIILNRITDVDETKLRLCQIVYIQPKHYEKVWKIMPPLQNVLLVSQSITFIPQGGMVNFDVQQKRVKLEVNLPSVKAARLKISSKLLKHAKVISGKVHENYKVNQDINAQN